MTRSRPRVDEQEDQVKHSYDHRGDTGKYAKIYKDEVETWWPKEGDHEIAIIPYLSKENSIFRLNNADFNKPFSEKSFKEEQAWSHKLTALIHGNIGVNKDNVLCPRTWKEPCPICEERDRLMSLDDDSKSMKERISALGASKRAIYNVLVFDSSDELNKGVQIWEAPHQSIEDVLSECYEDRRTGEKKYFTIPEEGWNVCFEKKGKGLGTEYRRVEILPRRQEDAFSDKELEELYAMAYNLEDIVEIHTYKELQELFKGVAEEEEKEEKEEPVKEEPRTRFRGGRSEKEEVKEKEPEKTEDSGELKIPEQYKDCFGIKNGDLEECDDCPKKVWESCYKETEKSKKPETRASGRRSL